MANLTPEMLAQLEKDVAEWRSMDIPPLDTISRMLRSVPALVQAAQKIEMIRAILEEEAPLLAPTLARFIQIKEVLDGRSH